MPLLRLASDCAGLEPLSASCKRLGVNVMMSSCLLLGNTETKPKSEHLRLAGLAHKLVYASESQPALKNRIEALYKPTTSTDDATDPMRALACKRTTLKSRCQGPCS